jgi:hypothetical protein
VRGNQVRLRARGRLAGATVAAMLIGSLAVAGSTVAGTGSQPADAAGSGASAYGAGHLMAADPSGGYWTATSGGGVMPHGGASQLGSPSASGMRLNRPIVSMAGTKGLGYWLVASDGGIFSYGDARFFGSTGSIHLNQPIVGMAPTPDGGGYWMVASDGGIFSYGNAPFYGSLGSSQASVLGMVVTPSTGGYSLITSDGNAHTFDPPAGSDPTISATMPLAPGGMTTGVYAAPFQGGPAQNDCAPAATPLAAPDASLDSLFQNQQGPGWVGGDEVYSTALPNNQESFVFSGTLVGTAQPDGEASFVGLPDNSAMSGTMPNLSIDVGGSPSAPTSLIPDAGQASWGVGATYMENGQQLVFVNEGNEISGSAYSTLTGRSGIAVLSLATGTPKFSTIELIPTDANTEWGNAMTQSGGYDYIYGTDMNYATDTWYGMKVARVPVGETLNTNAWTYWNGSSFVPGESNAVTPPGFPLMTGVIPLKDNTGFMAVGVGSSVSLTFSCSPTGPWSTPVDVYTVPELSEYSNEIAYTATFHPDLTTTGLAVSYSVDTLNGISALEQNDHLYQPRFIDLAG